MEQAENVEACIPVGHLAKSSTCFHRVVSHPPVTKILPIVIIRSYKSLVTKSHVIDIDNFGRQHVVHDLGKIQPRCNMSCSEFLPIRTPEVTEFQVAPDRVRDRFLTYCETRVVDWIGRPWNRVDLISRDRKSCFRIAEQSGNVLSAHTFLV